MSEGTRIARRRALLAGLAALGLAPCLPLLWRRRAAPALSAPVTGAARDPGLCLVVVELTGGMDGLSTVVPYADDEYHRLRPTLRLAPEEVLPIDRERAFAPALMKLRALHERGQVAIVEGAGYPDPFYSHFRAFEVWHTARRAGRASGDGWLGRLRAAAFPRDARSELLVHVGAQVPYSVACAARPALCFGEPGALRWRASGAARELRELAAAEVQASMEERSQEQPAVLDALRSGLDQALRASEGVRAACEAYRPRVEYPGGTLASSLRTVAALLDSGLGTRIAGVQQGNYDTHGGTMRARHARLLAELDSALGAFLADLEGTQAGSRTVVLLYSEFGRRAKENESRGTDHGAAGPMFLIGPRVAGGSYGAPPSLRELDPEGNLVHTLDFRRAYATVIEGCFGLPNERVLEERHEPLPILG